jgi:NDP-4-keto-2,6-dideoxyhexose 3-C-methyltransferase
MSQEITIRKTCRLCGSSALEDIFSLGELYISTFVEKKNEGIMAPLDLAFCDKCSLLQLWHTAPMEHLKSHNYCC